MDNKERSEQITEQKTYDESLCRNWIIDPHIQLHTDTNSSLQSVVSYNTKICP